MRLVLHPDQVRDALDLAAELDLDPVLVVQEMFGGPGTEIVLALPSTGMSRV